MLPFRPAALCACSAARRLAHPPSDGPDPRYDGVHEGDEQVPPAPGARDVPAHMGRQRAAGEPPAQHPEERRRAGDQPGRAQPGAHPRSAAAGRAFPRGHVRSPKRREEKEAELASGGGRDRPGAPPRPAPFSALHVAVFPSSPCCLALWLQVPRAQAAD